MGSFRDPINLFFQAGAITRPASPINPATAMLRVRLQAYPEGYAARKWQPG